MKQSFPSGFSVVVFLLLFWAGFSRCFGQPSSGREIQAVAFGNGTYVVAGDRSILISKDWTNWSNRSAFVTNDTVAINFDVETYVAYGDSLTVISPRNKSWAIKPKNTLFFRSVAFGKNTFVIVGYAGQILISPDGEYWRSLGTTITANLKGVVWGAGCFVAVGDGGGLFTSRDGIDWTSRNSGTDKDLVAVTYGNGLFVAVGGDGDESVILTSTDGINWTRSPDNNFSQLGAVAFQDGEFMASAFNPPLYIVSTNGINWTRDWNNKMFFPLAHHKGMFLKPTITYYRARGVYGTRDGFPPSRLLYGVMSQGMISIFPGRDEEWPIKFLTHYDDDQWIDSGQWVKTVRGEAEDSFVNPGNVVGNDWVYRIGGDRFVALSSQDGITWTLLKPTLATQTKPPTTPASISNPEFSNVGVEIQLNGKAYQLNLAAKVGQIYQLQASTDLEHWVYLTTLTNSGAALNFIDRDVTNYPQRFYRLKFQ